MFTPGFHTSPTGGSPLLLVVEGEKYFRFKKKVTRQYTLTMNMLIVGVASKASFNNILRLREERGLVYALTLPSPTDNEQFHQKTKVHLSSKRVYDIRLTLCDFAIGKFRNIKFEDFIKETSQVMIEDSCAV